jgi:hypothetical protein
MEQKFLLVWVDWSGGGDGQKILSGAAKSISPRVVGGSGGGKQDNGQLYVIKRPRAHKSLIWAVLGYFLVVPRPKKASQKYKDKEPNCCT